MAAHWWQFGGDAARHLLYAIEAMHNDGPFTRPDDYQKLNAVLRYSEGYANNGFNVSLMAYKADWNATDQIPLRAVQEGQLGRYDAIDNTDGGKAHRYSLSGAWRRTAEDSASKSTPTSSPTSWTCGPTSPTSWKIRCTATSLHSRTSA
jgi:hypothetical protein